eukprot:6449983-Prymnesium_polylepis.1
MEVPIGVRSGIIPACRHASMSHKIPVCRYNPESFQHAAMPASLTKSPRVSKATPPGTNRTLGITALFDGM